MTNEPAIQYEHELSNRTSGLIVSLRLLGIQMHHVINRLAPLDDLSHDQVVEGFDDQEPSTHKPVPKRIDTVRQLAERSLENLRQGLEELEGLFLRGEAKDRYEEPLRRNIGNTERLLGRLSELTEEEVRKSGNRVYEIRQSLLASLTAKCIDVMKDAEAVRSCETKCEHNEFRTAIAGYKRRLHELKRLFSKLRDNPSQKMASQLRAQIQEMDDIFVGLRSLSDSTFFWQESPIRGYSRGHGSRSLSKPSEAYANGSRPYIPAWQDPDLEHVVDRGDGWIVTRATEGGKQP